MNNILIQNYLFIIILVNLLLLFIFDNVYFDIFSINSIMISCTTIYYSTSLRHINKLLSLGFLISNISFILGLSLLLINKILSCLSPSISLFLIFLYELIVSFIIISFMYLSFNIENNIVNGGNYQY